MLLIKKLICLLFSKVNIGPQGLRPGAENERRKQNMNQNKARPPRARKPKPQGGGDPLEDLINSDLGQLEKFLAEIQERDKERFAWIDEFTARDRERLEALLDSFKGDNERIKQLLAGMAPNCE